jgi:hypothetical protein
MPYKTYSHSWNSLIRQMNLLCNKLTGRAFGHFTRHFHKLSTLCLSLTHNFPKFSISTRCLWECGITCGCPSRRTLCRTWQNFHATIRLSCKGSRFAHIQNVCAPFSWKVPMIVPGTQLRICMFCLASSINLTLQYKMITHPPLSSRETEKYNHDTNAPW